MLRLHGFCNLAHDGSRGGKAARTDAGPPSTTSALTSGRQFCAENYGVPRAGQLRISTMISIPDAGGR